MDMHVDVTDILLETEHLFLRGCKDVFDITLRENNTEVGSVRLDPPWSNMDSEFNCKTWKNISYTILPEYRGMGFVAEAVEKIIRYCFNAYDLCGVTFEHSCEDDEAASVIEGCGFRYTEECDGRLRYVLTNACMKDEPTKRVTSPIRAVTVALVAFTTGLFVVGFVIIPKIVNGKGVDIAVDETIMQTELNYSEDYTDIAFGKVCKYVDGEIPMNNLACAKGEIQGDWIAPADGWDMKTVGDFTYLHQVYKDGVLLLPLDYGANVYKVIGLDAEESDIDCSSCDEKNDGGSDIVN